MRLFLQVQINRFNHESFGSHLLKYASSLSSDLMGTDLDSQSDPAIADMVCRMVRQAESVFLLVQCNDPNIGSGAAQRVFNTLVEMEDKVSAAVLCGQHRTTETLLLGFQQRFSRESDPEKIKEMILEFSKGSRTPAGSS